MHDRTTLRIIPVSALIAIIPLIACVTINQIPPTSAPTITPTLTDQSRIAAGRLAALQAFAQHFWEGPEYTCAIREQQGACATYDEKWTVYWFFNIDFTTQAMTSIQVNIVPRDNFGLSKPANSYAYVEVCLHLDSRQWYSADLTSCEDMTSDPATAIQSLKQTIADDWAELIEALE